MFIFNFKVNGNKFSKIMFSIMILIILIIFSFGIYNIFLKEKIVRSATIKVSDTIKPDDVFEVTPENYTNILRAANDHVDDYVGCKIHFSGYVYRLLDFNENQFVLARDMIVSKDKQCLVVGFLCEYDRAKDFEDGTWVDITGEIKKGDFQGEIAIVNIKSINIIDKPEDEFVYPPDDNYIPTCNMF